MSITSIALQVAVLTLVGAVIMWAKNADKKAKNEQAPRSTIRARKLTSNDVGKAGLTELMFAAAEGNLRLVTERLATGEDVNAQDDMGKTALMYAAMNDHQEIIELLLEVGANPNLTTKANHTAEWFANEAGHGDALKLLK